MLLHTSSAHNRYSVIYFFSLSLLYLYFTAPAEYDGGFDGISSEMYDLDAEQSQARYDPRILSKELSGSHSPGSRETENGAHCMNANERYEHGQKVIFSLYVLYSFICVRIHNAQSQTHTGWILFFSFVCLYHPYITETILHAVIHSI